MSFSETLKELRIDANLTHASLAKKLGLTKSSIGFWESGRNEPTISSALLLAKFFNVSTDYLLGLDDSYAPSTIPQLKKVTPTFSQATSELLEDIKGLDEGQINYIRGVVFAYKTQINQQKKQG